MWQVYAKLMTEYDWSEYTNRYFPLTFLSLGGKKERKRKHYSLYSGSTENSTDATGTELTDSLTLLCSLSAWVLSLQRGRDATVSVCCFLTGMGKEMLQLF